MMPAYRRDFPATVYDTTNGEVAAPQLSPYESEGRALDILEAHAYNYIKQHSPELGRKEIRQRSRDRAKALYAHLKQTNYFRTQAQKEADELAAKAHEAGLILPGEAASAPPPKEKVSAGGIILA